jgi:hydrogenase maturation protease
VASLRRVAFLGIGHPLRRDDTAGVEVCERMRPRLRGRSDVLVVSGGSAPENCVGALRAFGPDLVVIIDAARMGQAPGTLLRIDPSDPRAAGACTHTLPLPVFCEYLAATLGCDVTLLGIEPADTSFGEGLTPAVERAVAEAARQATDELVRRPSLSTLVLSGDRHSCESRRAAPPYPLSADYSDITEGPWRRGGEEPWRVGGASLPPLSRDLTPPPASLVEIRLPVRAGGGDRGGGSKGRHLAGGAKERTR